jgi:hypothetical protein
MPGVTDVETARMYRFPATLGLIIVVSVSAACERESRHTFGNSGHNSLSGHRFILGFEQLLVTTGIAKRGSSAQKTVKNVIMPSPWNNLEAGILFGLGLPLLIFREKGLGGGVFDNGVTDVFVQNMPPATATRADSEQLRELILKWQSRVREHYYRL